jgi:hypothetical protein
MPVDIDPLVAHPARIYDYWLGGKDNFAADREAAEQAAAVRPGIKNDVKANRAFLHRAVRYLAADAGIRQFLDIGAGFPTVSNTHEVAQRVLPDSRVVYVDNDPMVLSHSRALLTSTQEGALSYLEADVRDTSAILAEAAARLDFTRPVALLMLMILQVIPDADDPGRIVAELLDPLPPGSYLAISHPASDIEPEMMAALAMRLNEHMRGTPVRFRTRAEVSSFFTGLDLVEPGLVQMNLWRPAADDPPSAYDLPDYAAVAAKP